MKGDPQLDRHVLVSDRQLHRMKFESEVEHADLLPEPAALKRTSQLKSRISEQLSGCVYILKVNFFGCTLRSTIPYSTPGVGAEI